MVPAVLNAFMDVDILNWFNGYELNIVESAWIFQKGRDLIFDEFEALFVPVDCPHLGDDCDELYDSKGFC